MWFAILFAGLAVLLIQQYRVMSALRDSDPALYQHFGGGSLVANPVGPALLMITVLFGIYRSKFSGSAARALAGQYQLCLIAVFAFLLLSPLRE